MPFFSGNDISEKHPAPAGPPTLEQPDLVVLPVHFEHRPALQRGENGATKMQSPAKDGRTSLQHPWQGIESMFLEKRLRLLAETTMPVILFLRADVFHRILDSRNPDAESAKTLRPCKPMLA